MPHFVVTATGADQPGIIAAVTGVLVEQGCQLEDTEMAVLHGHFAMMLVVVGPDGLTALDLEDALAKGATDLDMAVIVRSIPDPAPGLSPQPGRGGASGAQPASLWSVSVHGANRPGIVFEVARILARHDVNIVGMETRVVADRPKADLAMSLDVSVPDRISAEDIVAELDALTGQMGAICSMRPR
jgi:glycine cleavage system transcriptional repressor